MLLLATRHAAHQFRHRMDREITEEEAKITIARSDILFAKTKKRDRAKATLYLCAGEYALIGIPGPLVMWGGFVIDTCRVVTVLSRGNAEYERLVLDAAEECADVE